MGATLHYIHDPLCGWCYGAAPLVTAAETVPGLEVALHGGGLFPQPTKLPAEMRAYIRQADARVAAMSGQPYGAAYLEGLLDDPDLILDSRPPIAAVLAARAVDPALELPMLRAIQRGHWVEGLRVIEPAVLDALAQRIGLPPDAFAAARAQVPVDAHIGATQRLMGRVGAGGFPTFVLEVAEQLLPVPHQRFATAPATFADWLTEELRSRAA